LFVEVPPFDALTGQTAPFAGFGNTEIMGRESPVAFAETVNEATRRLRKGFDVVYTPDVGTIGTIEKIIAQMWDEGWNPSEGNVNLFCTDFGCLVTYALLESLGGNLVFRSRTDLSHASIWWPEKSIEVFPFHATSKRLTIRDGQSLDFFAKGVASLLA
jgi:hypothetical protein